MSDGSPQGRSEGDTDTGAKPSIAEVAAWLRRAAESRDTTEELRPVRRPVAPAPPPPSAPVEPSQPAGALPVDRVGAEEPPVVQEPVADAPAPHVPPPDEPPPDEPAPNEAAPDDAPSNETASNETASNETALDETAVELPPAAEEPAAGPVVGPAAPFDRLSDDATVWSAPADEAAASPVRADDDAAAPATTAPVGQAQPEAPADEGPAPAARAEAAGPDHDRAAGSPLWVGHDEGAGGIEGAPAQDPDVPVVSPALALFASAVVRHNTAEVAAIRPQRDEPPKAEALFEDELPLAGDADTDTVAAVAAEAPPEAPPVHGATASLFDLDLAELAARARGRAEDRALAAPPPPADVERLAPDVEDRVLEARGGSVDTSGLGLSWDIEAYDRAEGDLLDGETEADTGSDDQAAEEAARPKPPATAPLAAAMARRRARRKRYPRGQLRERIGFLRRVRAMLGVVVLTVVLGVAAGAAIGAFLVFLAFAVRSAITSS